MATSTISESEFNNHVSMFTEFYDSQTVYGEGGDYKERIRSLLRYNEQRLLINLNDLRIFRRDIADKLLLTPIEFIPAAEKALQEYIAALPEKPASANLEGAQWHVGFEGSFGEFHTNPRSLTARMIGRLVAVDGIVTSCSLVRPKMLKSVHYCEKKKSFLEREYRDATMISNNLPTTSNTYPTTDADNNPLSTEFGFCSFQDHQSICIQEMPERAPAGQLPRSVDVVLDDDLVDRVKPGDRVQVIGVYKTVANVFNGQVPAHFRTVLVANNLRTLGKELSVPVMTETDIQNIKLIAKRKDVFELLARSVSPSIYGHDFIKKAVLLMLLGGREWNLDNGTHIRGDINVLMIGDPSTAKSQMLRFVLNIAPLAIATTGRGSSGVGLTAAVLTDKETGDRRLEAGAMVLADRGVVCIDEFDKMSDNDRVAIHEVMEQQTVTIAKAGIHASLNARCSVIAAANPIWGQYRESISPQENIGLPDSLISRFDLLFIVLDTSNPSHDRSISSHVIKMHRYLPPGVEEGTPFTNKTRDEESIDSSTEASIFHQQKTGGQEEYLSVSFLKKFLFFAKSRIKPTLSKSAADYIVEAYSEFRQQREMGDIKEMKTFPVTPRTLETLIRLATAHAKSRLSSKVEKKDAVVARELVEFCLYKEVKPKLKIKKQKVQSVAHASDDEESEEEDEDEDNEKKLDSMSKLSLASKMMDEDDEFSFKGDGDEGFKPRNRKDKEPMQEKDSQTQEMTQGSSSGTSSIPSPELVEAVTSVLLQLRNKNPDQSFLTMPVFMRALESNGVDFTEQAVHNVLKDLEAENKLMFREELIIFL